MRREVAVWIVVALALTGILVFVTGVSASPFLVCDPPLEGEDVTEYVLSIDGAPEVVTPAPLHYDLAGISMGNHSLVIRARNLWEESDNTPFDFTARRTGAVVSIKVVR